MTLTVDTRLPGELASECEDESPRLSGLRSAGRSASKDGQGILTVGEVGEERLESQADLLADWYVTEVEASKCGFFDRFVMQESDKRRRVWEVVLGVCLVYTATVFLYRVCFIQFRIVGPAEDASSDCPGGQETVAVCQGFFAFDNYIINTIFWVDLILNFFFSYLDPDGVEVLDMYLVAWNYLQTYFFINLIACIPSEAAEEIVSFSTGSHDIHKTTRVMSMPRLSRLGRLIRLTRLVKIASFKVQSPVLKRLQSLRGVRILSKLGWLALAVHLMACGWYLCAALHEDPSKTWVARRMVDEEVSLLDKGHFVQWLHSVYFVLTVFTTVGFGDMSAVTEGEILYVCATMLVGAVVHSIVVSEVISVVQKQDEVKVFLESHLDLFEAYSEHAELDSESVKSVKEWVQSQGTSWMKTRYDRGSMKAIIKDKFMPRSMMGELPQKLFQGLLIRSRFLSCDGCARFVPPRLPLLLSLSVSKNYFDFGEVVFEMHDFPFNAFLVLSGTFAHVAVPSPDGGVDAPIRSIPVMRRSHGAHLLVNGAPSKDMNSKMKDPSSGSRSGSPVRRASTKSMSRSMTHGLGDGSIEKLYPYRLFSHSSYFGEHELLTSTKLQPRSSTVRCESTQGGCLLVLPKNELFQLCEEFPKFASLWKAVSQRRESFRKASLQSHTKRATYKHLAATVIQRACIALRQYRRTYARLMMMTGTFDIHYSSAWDPPSEPESEFQRDRRLKRIRRLLPDMDSTKESPWANCQIYDIHGQLHQPPWVSESLPSLYDFPLKVCTCWKDTVKDPLAALEPLKSVAEETQTSALIALLSTLSRRRLSLKSRRLWEQVLTVPGCADFLCAIGFRQERNGKSGEFYQHEKNDGIFVLPPDINIEPVLKHLEGLITQDAAKQTSEKLPSPSAGHRPRSKQSGASTRLEDLQVSVEALRSENRELRTGMEALRCDFGKLREDLIKAVTSAREAPNPLIE